MRYDRPEGVSEATLPMAHSAASNRRPSRAAAAAHAQQHERTMAMMANRLLPPGVSGQPPGSSDPGRNRAHISSPHTIDARPNGWPSLDAVKKRARLVGSRDAAQFVAIGNSTAGAAATRTR